MTSLVECFNAVDFYFIIFQKNKKILYFTQPTICSVTSRFSSKIFQSKSLSGYIENRLTIISIITIVQDEAIADAVWCLSR